MLSRTSSPFNEQPLCQRFDVWPMLLHELACLADHFVDESLGVLSVAVSSQQCEVRCLYAVVGITPRRGPDMLPFGKSGCDEHFQCVFDLVVVPSNRGVLATDVSQSAAACPASW